MTRGSQGHVKRRDHRTPLGTSLHYDLYKHTHHASVIHVSFIMPISHRRHGQDKTVLSSLFRVGGVNRIGDKTTTFLSCLDPVSNLQLFGLKYIDNY